jgi:hypothetical protein
MELGWLTHYELDYRWFGSRQGLGIFLFTMVSRSSLGPTPSLLSKGYQGSFPGVKRPPSSAEVNNAWSYTSTLPIRLTFPSDDGTSFSPI